MHLVILLSLLAAATLVIAGLLLRRLLSGHELVPAEPRRPVPWGLVHLVLTVFLWLLAVTMAASVVLHHWELTMDTPFDEMPPAARTAYLASLIFAHLLVLALSIQTIRATCRASRHDLGLDRSRFVADVKLGLKAFLILAPPVYLVQAILTQWFPSEHPLVVALQQQPDPLLIAVVFATVVVVAPLWEEYLFRLLLQGWLEKIPTCQDASEWILGNSAAGRLFAKPLAGSPQGESAATIEHRVRPIPILLSSLLFAAAHYRHGPDPIPLVLLALGLGYLYQKTHRLVPCIVVHAALNATSLAMLML